MTFDHILYLIEGTFINISYALISGTLAFFLAFFLLFSPFKKINLFYMSIFRGTPLLVQLSFFYFIFPKMIHLDLSIFASGLICLTLNSTAYMLASLDSILKSIQIEELLAADLLQFSQQEKNRYIIFPQVLRTGISALGNEFINLIKESSILSFIGEVDLIRRFQLIASETYSYFPPLFICALCFYLTILFFSLILKKIEENFLC